MNPIILIAEFAAYGIAVVLEEGELYLIGDPKLVPESLRCDIRDNVDAVVEHLGESVMA